MVKIFYILRSIDKNQLGFTMMELAIAMVISGIISGTVTMTIFQVFDTSGRTSHHMTAISEVRSAGYWVSHDVLMAQDLVLSDEAVDDPDGSRFPFTVTWSDWTSTEEHTVVYSIVDDELQRAHSINSGAATVAVVAEFIDPENTGCEYSDGTLVFTVTVTVGAGSAAQTETRVYEIVPRPG